MNLQALADGLSAQWQKERSESQMTLGDVIERLEAIPPETIIKGLGGLDSYRGYYSDLAFGPDSSGRTAKEILEECRSAMGKVFVGYKGGDFLMGETTPVWVASYGCCGEKLMAIHDNGEIETEEED